MLLGWTHWLILDSQYHAKFDHKMPKLPFFLSKKQNRFYVIGISMISYYMILYGDFLKWGYPQIIHFDRIKHLKTI